MLGRHKPDQHMDGTSFSKILKDVGLWMKVSICCRVVGALQRSMGLGLHWPVLL